MFKNKNNGRNNICGKNIMYLRKNNPVKMSQRILASQMQLMGIDIDKNAVQRIESGQRFVTDIELLALSRIFNASCDDLLTKNMEEQSICCEHQISTRLK